MSSDQRSTSLSAEVAALVHAAKAGTIATRVDIGRLEAIKDEQEKKKPMSLCSFTLQRQDVA